MPGGRFGELYYWDSYFTMLGLEASGRHDLVRAMADNFAYLLDSYGLVPNGTRSYYLSRSQPPVFTLMTELFEAQGLEPPHAYLPHLRAEHAFWMDGAERLSPGTAHRRVVRLPDGSLLNRYWDDHARPREESFLEDVVTAHRGDRPAHLVFRDLRAAAESGWDFSSRWLDESAPGMPASLSTIRTTAILPIDLNALLWHAETRLSALCERTGDAAGAARYAAMAHARREAVERHLWHPELGAFVDYDWHRGARRQCLTAATVMPLFVGLASDHQAAAIGAALRTRLLAEGGTGHDLRALGRAVGPAQRLGTAAVAGHPGPAPPWRRGAGARDRRPLAVHRRRPLSARIQARREIPAAPQGPPCTWRRRRRISAAGRLRLDQRRGGDAAAALSGASGGGDAGRGWRERQLRSGKPGTAARGSVHWHPRCIDRCSGCHAQLVTPNHCIGNSIQKPG
ncbi:trehalase family glycosidase [Cupriavidus sp. H18C1]|uniref:trehalase family glycosidase n=1 Tax=Cupriavidus sp. H18C1 TaxID=3241601 RepID=UPI003BB93A49